MNIIVHYPKSKESLYNLQKMVASVHAEAVLRYLQKMPCLKGQQLKIINELIEKG